MRVRWTNFDCSGITPGRPEAQGLGKEPLRLLTRSPFPLRTVGKARVLSGANWGGPEGRRQPASERDVQLLGEGRRRLPGVSRRAGKRSRLSAASFAPASPSSLPVMPVTGRPHCWARGARWTLPSDELVVRARHRQSALDAGPVEGYTYIAEDSLPR